MPWKIVPWKIVPWKIVLWKIVLWVIVLWMIVYMGISSAISSGISAEMSEAAVFSPAMVEWEGPFLHP